MDQLPVTIVVSRRPAPGRERDLAEWAQGLLDLAARFPGHLGMTVIRPRPGAGTYTFMFRFATHDQLRAWDDSEERKAWVARADELAGPARRDEAVGIEAWFALPEAGSPRPPPRWKMAIASWLVAFPTIQILNTLLAPRLAILPPLARGAAVGVCMILFMTYAAMPVATRALRPWLYPTGR